MNAKVQSILSYLGMVWLLAYFAGKDQRNHLSSYHLKQGLVLWLITVLFNIAVFLIGMLSVSLAVIISYFQYYISYNEGIRYHQHR